MEDKSHRYVHSKFRHKTLTSRQLDAKISQPLVLEIRSLVLSF